jgi:hypothetical protein
MRQSFDSRSLGQSVVKHHWRTQCWNWRRDSARSNWSRKKAQTFRSSSRRGDWLRETVHSANRQYTLPLAPMASSFSSSLKIENAITTND